MAQRKYQDNDIAQALVSSVSVADAARKLGMAPTNLEARCRAEGLNALYEKCAERGRRNGGPRPRKPRRLPSWAVFWTPPGAKPVQVWHIEAEDEGQALLAYARIKPPFINAAEVSAAEEIR